LFCFVSIGRGHVRCNAVKLLGTVVVCSGLGSLGDPTPEHGFIASILCWSAGNVLKTRCNFVDAVMKFGFTSVQKKKSDRRNAQKGSAC
jgi:hypothetical protein